MRRSNAVWLFAVVYSALGFSIYFALGIVAERALALTPVVFLVSGLLFLVSMLTYGEGASMFRERGGSSMFARYAFNELVSFIAGWAILIDYLVVMALAALAAGHYLAPLPGLGGDMASLGIAVVLIASVAMLNIRDVTGRGRAPILATLALADVALQVLIVAVGAFLVWQPELVIDSVSLFAGPSVTDAIYAAVIAMLAYAGLEAAANLAPDVNVERRRLGQVIMSGAVTLPLTYAGMAFVALMAVPVISGPDGATTALGTEYLEAPFLGVVASFDPDWLSAAMKWLVVVVAVPTLAWAANISMLGVSRHIYALAINRQIPSWLGKLESRHQTPWIAIVISAVVVVAMVIPGDVVMLAEIYAFGATLAIAIAHLSILRLRSTDPLRTRPFLVPLGIRLRAGRTLPLPAVLGAVMAIAAFASVIALHETARWVGGAWMGFGLIAYVVYRKGFEGTSLTARVQVSAGDLAKRAREVSYQTILVPVFGAELDDDIVGTAGRLAGSVRRGRDRFPYRSRLDLVYVVEVPLTESLDAPLSPRSRDRADAAIRRALDVASEYRDVDVTARVLRARSAGAGIVDAASEETVEAIVMGGEPPSRVKGGAIYGGHGGGRPEEIGPATEYVLRRSPCPVLLTAPPGSAA